MIQGFSIKVVLYAKKVGLQEIKVKLLQNRSGAGWIEVQHLFF